MGRMNASDHPYKLIHADPRMLEDALRGFVAPDWADQLDFGTLAPLDKERIGPALGNRVGDNLWRVERRDGPPLANGRRPYINILFEFQSAPDPDMAWRMHEYLYLLELSQRDIGALREEGRPPDFLAVVIHNGTRPWNASSARFGPLLGPPTPEGRALNQWRSYLVVDYPAIAGDHALMQRLPAGNRQAALIRLETASPDHLPAVLMDALRRWDGPESAGLRRGFHARARSVMGRHGLTLPSLAECERMLADRKGGTEMTALMEATFQKYFDEIEARGVERGIAQGMERGMERGMAQGMAQGHTNLLRHLAERRFGAEAAGQLSGLLAGMDTDRLIEVGDWMLECRTAGELLNRLNHKD